ncbi:sporulation initiation phosphotransferase F [Reticulibacter mediterranei]|uniref:Sporulation initiation phosphotransferase F n=1 Tax=Reticulibacter mediterranei TaxID=2778369 RepID=A0A8J3IRK5_9CHLR|nr:response regulator [Reticulibacter mediterranei]GHO94071.1 sporulation initiation phosphotransferase F [Reticulibacter mediterranei]
MQSLQQQPNTHNPSPEKIILVVEDDDSIGSMLLEALSQETPYKPVWVSDGFQALQAVRSTKPDLFITDYRLPNMNGIELYDRLRGTHNFDNTPAIIMSAYLPEDEVRKRRLIGLNKPFEIDEFLETIEKLIP